MPFYYIYIQVNIQNFKVTVYQISLSPHRQTINLVITHHSQLSYNKFSYHTINSVIIQ